MSICQPFKKRGVYTHVFKNRIKSTQISMKYHCQYVNICKPLKIYKRNNRKNV